MQHTWIREELSWNYYRKKETVLLSASSKDDLLNSDYFLVVD